MPREFIELDIEEISAVDHPANKRKWLKIKKAAKPPLAKQMDEESDSEAHSDAPLTTAARLEQSQLWQQWWPLWDAFTTSMYELFEHCREHEMATAGPLMVQAIDEFQAQAVTILEGLGLMAKAAPLLAAFEVIEKAGRAMSAARMQQLESAIGTLQAILEEVRMPETTQKGRPMPSSDTLEIITKRAETAEARMAALEAELQKARMTPEEQEAAYLAGLPEVVRKQYEADKIEKAELRRRLEEEIAKGTRLEYIQKTAQYRAVGFTPDHWNVLKAVDGLAEQERTELLRILDSVTAVLKASRLLTTLGSDGGGNSGESAQARIEKAAKDKVATSNGALTYQQAYARILEEQPALLMAMRAESREG